VFILPVAVVLLAAVCTEAFSTVPRSRFALGLRHPFVAGLRPATRRNLQLRMVHMDDGDVVFQRVNARMDLEPVQLIIAYCEHAYHAESADIPADMLERCLGDSASSPPTNEPLATDGRATSTQTLSRTKPPSLPKIGGGPPTLSTPALSDFEASTQEKQNLGANEEGGFKRGMPHPAEPFDATAPRAATDDEVTNVLERARAMDATMDAAEQREDAASVLERVKAMGMGDSNGPS
jgi:hypothetical protein